MAHLAALNALKVSGFKDKFDGFQQSVTGAMGGSFPSGKDAIEPPGMDQLESTINAIALLQMVIILTISALFAFLKLFKISPPIWISVIFILLTGGLTAAHFFMTPVKIKCIPYIVFCLSFWVGIMVLYLK